MDEESKQPPAKTATKSTTKRAIKITAFSLLGVIGLFVLIVVGYILYVVIQYNRIGDNFALRTEQQQTRTLTVGGSYSAATYNIGFGAYDQEYSFFMDTGKMADGTKTKGKYGKARSKDRVLTNTSGALAETKKLAADFLLLQEVDTDSTRSYGVNQLAMATEAFGADYAYNYAVNFHSAYLLYPFNDPHGLSNAGLATYSRYRIESGVRRSYPIAKGFAKYFDLDRCFAVLRLPVDNGKELVLINSHMSAYDEGGLIRQQQLAMLNGVLAEEYAKGNYVIAGGDFNHDIADSGNLFPTTQLYPDWVFQLTDEDLAEHFSFAAAVNAPTCRGADIPYTKGETYTVVIDGFVVSDNVRLDSVQNIDLDFLYSDHNPAKMEFTLL